VPPVVPYRRTFDGSVPVYVTMMHEVSESPGLRSTGSAWRRGVVVGEDDGAGGEVVAGVLRSSR
jgi:hypothetical protein